MRVSMALPKKAMKITEVWRGVPPKGSSKSGPIGGYLLRVLGPVSGISPGTRTHVVLANILLQPWMKSSG